LSLKERAFNNLIKKIKRCQTVKNQAINAAAAGGGVLLGLIGPHPPASAGAPVFFM